MPYLVSCADGSLLLRLHVQPRASRNEIGGIHGDAIKLRLMSPPVDGKANKAVIAYLAGIFGLDKGSLQIRSGLQSRSKLISIIGADEQFVRQRLAELLSAN